MRPWRTWFRGWAASSQPDLACREFVELVTEYLEDALPRREVRRVRRHLAACDGCSNYLEQVQLTMEALRTIPADPVPDQLVESVAAAVRERALDEPR